MAGGALEAFAPRAGAAFGFTPAAVVAAGVVVLVARPAPTTAVVGVAALARPMADDPAAVAVVAPAADPAWAPDPASAPGREADGPVAATAVTGPNPATNATTGTTRKTTETLNQRPNDRSVKQDRTDPPPPLDRCRPPTISSQA